MNQPAGQPAAAPMTNAEARLVFATAAANETDPDKRANIEICREYFTNPDFRRGLEDLVAAKNGLYPEPEPTQCEPLRRFPSTVRCCEQGCRREVAAWDEFVDAGSRTVFTIYACAGHAVEGDGNIKRWKALPVDSAL